MEVLRCYIATLLKKKEERIEVGGDRKFCWEAPGANLPQYGYNIAKIWCSTHIIAQCFHNIAQQISHSIAATLP